MTPQTLQKLIGVGLIVFVIVVLASQGTYIVEPGHRGVRVTLGKVSDEFVPEGLAFKWPIVTQIHPVNIKQQTEVIEVKCYTSDLQQVITELRVRYRIPEAAVVDLWRDYQSDDIRLAPSYFRKLIRPRVVEALKEAEATESAEQIVQKREIIKEQTLSVAREKLSRTTGGKDLVTITDMALLNLQLSPELTAAIEQKMTQEQEAEKAKFFQEQVTIEADTAIIRAKGEAESIDIRGHALRENPLVIDLQIIEQWDGVSPVVVGGGSDGGAGIMIPVDPFARDGDRR